MAGILPVTPTLLTTFETCPYQYYGKYVTKEVAFEESPALIEGNAVHKALENVLIGKESLPEKYQALQPAANLCFALQKNEGMEMHVEANVCVDHEYKATHRWGKIPPHMYAKADVILVDNKKSEAFVIDWKTGAYKEDAYETQRNILALCTAVNYNVDKVHCLWVYTAAGKTKHQEVFPNRQGEFRHLLMSVEAYRMACRDDKFPHKPNGLCKKWCGVMSCPHNGRN